LASGHPPAGLGQGSPATGPFAHRSVLVVPVPNADVGPPLEGVSRVEKLAEDSVGRGVEGDEKGKEPVHDPRPPCRWELQPGDTRLPLHYGCGKTGLGWGRRGERGVGIGAQRAERGEEVRGGAGCRGTHVRCASTSMSVSTRVYRGLSSACCMFFSLSCNLSFMQPLVYDQ